VGYTGGTAESPTYRKMGDHTESIQIDYDPTQTSYSDLLKLFWSSHTTSHPAWSKQYMSAIFFANKEQEKDANASIKGIKKKNKNAIQRSCN